MRLPLALLKRRRTLRQPAQRAALLATLLLPPSGLFAAAASPAAAPAIVVEDIFTTAPFPSCHASTLVELRNGDLLAAWFGGSGEGKPDVAIWAARRTAAGWSAPYELAREPGTPSWNPVLFHSADGRLWLYYKVGPVVAEWTGARKVSSDEGRTWSAPEHLPAGELGPVRAKPYVAPDGAVVAGSSTESYHAWAAWIERSTDNAVTWQRLGPFTLADAVIRRLQPVPAAATIPPGLPGPAAPRIGELGPAITSGLIQPSVVSLGGRHLRFYARSSSNIGRICASDSYDEGRTWSPARPLDLPNPNSGIDAVTLRDGRIVLLYNPTTAGRTPLSLAVSRDGEHFRVFHTLESEPGEYSYPALIEARDGNLLATYTWRRTRIRFARIPLALVPRQQSASRRALAPGRYDRFQPAIRSSRP